MSLDQTKTQSSIATELFDLRPVRVSDKGLLSYYASDKRVALMTSRIPHPMPPGAIDAFIAQACCSDREEIVWVMDGLRTGLPECMGLISLKILDRGQSEIGYWVGPPHWNSGVARAAVKALLESNPLRNCTIFANVFQDNPASARVLTNAGFEYIGDAESFSVARNANVQTWTYLRKMGRT
jgi:RimJ/RimL family protein N-acetyltransferase